MSKAVEKAYEAYPLNEENHLNHEWNAKRVGFQQGYEQAEKDLELTWKDIENIDKLLWELCEKWSNKKDNAGYYQEVLKRFKERKGE